MQNLSNRERILVMAMPSGILLLVYFFFGASPANDEIKELKRRIGVFSKRGDLKAQNMASQSKLRIQEAKLKKAKAKAKGSEKKVEDKGAMAKWDDLSLRGESGRFVENVLGNNGVVLLEESVAPDGERKQFEEILKPIPAGQLWKLRIAGNYLSVQQSIAEIGASDLPVVPAAIEMEPFAPGKKSVHLWNFWICR